MLSGGWSQKMSRRWVRRTGALTLIEEMIIL